MKSILSIFLLLLPLIVFSQIKKYGDISLEEFQTNEYKNADAYVIFKKRESRLEFENMVGWRLITTVHERIKINSKNGYKYATKKIKRYISRNEYDEKIKIKATTYNINNKEIIKTKLKQKDIFTEILNKRWGEKRFTMPNIKENSILEWKYTIESNYFYVIDDVVFQYDIPIKYFKAKIKIIGYLKFKYWFTNKLHAIIDTKKGLGIEISNVPALKKEPYVKNIDLYRAKIIFDVFASDFPNNSYHDFSKTWGDVVKTIYENKYFGDPLKETDYFERLIPNILANSKTKKDSILKILNFVKNRVKWNKYLGKYTDKGVAIAFKNRTGNIADINLMLTAMLRTSGFEANPILLNTRKHAEPYFPTLSGFNYVICGVEIDDDVLLLDASEKYSYIDNLPLRTINEIGRMVRKNGSSIPIKLQPKKPTITKQNINVSIDENMIISGNFRMVTNGLKALKYRNKLNNLNDENLINFFEKKYNPIEIEKIRLLNKEKLDKSFVVSSLFKGSDALERIDDKILIKPLLFLQKKETVFKSDKRKYPIDLETAQKEIIRVSITIPKGYKLLNKPDDVVSTLENNQGAYSYSIKEENDKILIKVVRILSNPIIKAEDYTMFKQFLLNIIQKENENIVLVKS